MEGNQEQKRFYKKYQNKLTKVKHLAKKIFYKEQFTLNKGNPRKTWDLINSALSATKQKRKKSAIDRLVLDNKVISDSNSITETFNRHFASIGKNWPLKSPPQIHVKTSSNRKYYLQYS